MKVLKLTDCDHIENGSNHSHQQYCAKMIKKQSKKRIVKTILKQQAKIQYCLPVWHKISSIKNDWGKHEEEENIGSECGGRMLRGEEQEKTNDDSHHDEQTGLGENVV